MTESPIVALVERWQTGAFLLLGSALAGFLAAAVAGEYVGPPTTLAALLGTATVVFLALSYLRYGRDGVQT